MRPQILIPKNPGVVNKLTFGDGYDFKDVGFFFGLGMFLSAVLLAPLLIVFENDEDFTLVYQCVAAFAVWIFLSVIFIKKWVGRESMWRVFIHLLVYLFRKKRHVFYVLKDSEVPTPKRENLKKTKNKNNKQKKVNLDDK